MDCARKHTLVTGCSSGIGRATALRLAAAGQHVYAGVRHPADGEQLARSAAGGELTPLILDVTDTSHIAAAAAAVTGHTGPAGLHGLVNNAGFGLACPTELVQLEAFLGERMYISRRTVQTHLAHIFAKLDISSRAQLAAEVIRQQD